MQISQLQRQFLALARRIRDDLSAIRESHQHQEHAEHKEEKATEKQPDPTPEIRAILDTLQGISKQYGATNAADNKYQQRNLIVQIAGVIVVAIYASVAAWQACTMSGTLKEIRKQTPKLTESADASVSALAESERHFRIDERPYLTKDYVRLGERPTMGRKLAGEVFWKNTGRTPAVHVHSWLRIDVLDHEPRNPARWAYLAKAQKSQIDFGSGVGRSVVVEGNNPLGEPWLGEIAAKTFHVYIYGAIVYQDVFGEWHESYVCAVYEPGSVNDLFLWGCKGSHVDDVK